MNEGGNLQHREKITTLKCSARRGKRAGFHLQSHKGIFMIFFTNRKIHKESKHEQFVSGSSLTMQRLGGCFLDRGSKLADSLQSSSGSPKGLYKESRQRQDYTGDELRKLQPPLCVYMIYKVGRGSKKAKRGTASDGKGEQHHALIDQPDGLIEQETSPLTDSLMSTS